MMEAALLLKKWGKNNNNKPKHFKSHTMYHCMTKYPSNPQILDINHHLLHNGEIALIYGDCFFWFCSDNDEGVEEIHVDILPDVNSSPSR